MAPMALIYLVISQEALAVRTNIRMTKAFIGAARLSRQDVAKSSANKSANFGSRVTMMADKNNCGINGICPSKAMAFAMSAIGLATGGSQAVNAQEMTAPAPQVRWDHKIKGGSGCLLFCSEGVEDDDDAHLVVFPFLLPMLHCYTIYNRCKPSTVSQVYQPWFVTVISLIWSRRDKLRR